MSNISYFWFRFCIILVAYSVKYQTSWPHFITSHIEPAYCGPINLIDPSYKIHKNYTICFAFNPNGLFDNTHHVSKSALWSRTTPWSLLIDSDSNDWQVTRPNWFLHDWWMTGLFWWSMSPPGSPRSRDNSLGRPCEGPCHLFVID